jgi:hypothetical protein
MKKILLTLLLLAFTASLATAEIKGSKHDLSVDGLSATGNGEVRICAFCHTPHHAVPVAGQYAPLWSHEESQTDFIPYATPTFSQSGITTDTMAGGSALCMGCHDGSVATDAYYGLTGTSFENEDGWGDVGVGLAGVMQNDHPVGFSYGAAYTADTILGNANLNDKTADLSTTFASEASVLAKFNISKISDVLFSDPSTGITDMMTCGTCHDVHNGPLVVDEASNAYSIQGGEYGGARYFLYGPQEDSGLCRMCHAK